MDDNHRQAGPDTTVGKADYLPDEFAALANPCLVMREVLGLVEDLHRATTRLGDALVAAGLPARLWRGTDCQLSLLSDQFPDITLDDLVTRLAEFAAGMGPHWLHGGADDVLRFNDEVSILHGVARPLRIVAQRLRMLSSVERGEYPLERALGDMRIGTPLDRVTTLLRDLESLGPYIQPLTAGEWTSPPLIPAPAGAPAPKPARSLRDGRAEAATSGELLPSGFGQLGTWPATQSEPVAAPATAPPVQRPQADGQTFRRLRDFMAPAGEPHAAPTTPIWTRVWARMALIKWRALPTTAVVHPRAAARWLRQRKLLVVGTAIMLLALGTALLTLAAQPAPARSALVAQPARLSFTCSGAGTTLVLRLRDTDSRPLTWMIAATPPTQPAGFVLSATHGTLQPSATVLLRIHVTAAKPAQGTLVFTSTDGNAFVAYTVACK